MQRFELAVLAERQTRRSDDLSATNFLTIAVLPEPLRPRIKNFCYRARGVCRVSWIHSLTKVSLFASIAPKLGIVSALTDRI